MERYEEVLRMYLDGAACFKKPIDQVGRRDVKAFLAGVYQTKSPATVETVHAIISGIFNEATRARPMSRTSSATTPFR